MFVCNCVCKGVCEGVCEILMVVRRRCNRFISCSEGKKIPSLSRPMGLREMSQELPLPKLPPSPPSSLALLSFSRTMNLSSINQRETLAQIELCRAAGNAAAVAGTGADLKACTLS